MTDGWAIPGFTWIRDLEPAGGQEGGVAAALDDVTRTPVAIKFVPPGARQAFPVVRRLSRVEDPNVVGVYEVLDEPSAIIMEFVENGVSLQRILATQGPTGPLAALAVLSSTLLGLDAAHRAGVVHGSYRPGSLLVAPDGLGKLIGFGLGRPAGDGTVGEPAYLAPEQWAGAEPDRSADLYAATAVFFECLTGHQPYQGRKPGDLARAHQASAIPVEEVPGPLQRLIARGLAKHSAERPTSATEFAGELEDAAVAAYGVSWESQGRSRLAEMAERAAAAPDPVPGGRRGRGRSARPAPEAGTAAAGFGPPGDVMGVPGDAPGRVFDAGAGRRTDPVFSAPTAESEHSSLGPTVDSPPQQGSVATMPGAGGSGGNDGPQVTFRPRAAAGSRRRSRRGLLIGSGAVVGALAVAGVTLTVLSGGGGSGSTTATDHPQSPPAPAGSSSAAPLANPEATALAERVAKAVDLRQSAAFTYQGPGGSGGPADSITATGVLKSGSAPPASYDMTVWNPGDKRFAKHLRTILVADTGYVMISGWKPAPAEHSPAKSDLPHVYTAMAANARWAGSPPALLAILRATTVFKQAAVPGAYTGTASLSALASDPSLAPLWSVYDDSRYKLNYTVRIGPDDLPQRLDIRLEPKGGDGPSARATGLDFRTVFTHWGRKTVIAPPPGA